MRIETSQKSRMLHQRYGCTVKKEKIYTITDLNQYI